MDPVPAVRRRLVGGSTASRNWYRSTQPQRFRAEARYMRSGGACLAFLVRSHTCPHRSSVLLLRATQVRLGQRHFQRRARTHARNGSVLAPRRVEVFVSGGARGHCTTSATTSSPPLRVSAPFAFLLIRTSCCGLLLQRRCPVWSPPPRGAGCLLTWHGQGRLLARERARFSLSIRCFLPLIAAQTLSSSGCCHLRRERAAFGGLDPRFVGRGKSANLLGVWCVACLVAVFRWPITRFLITRTSPAQSTTQLQLLTLSARALLLPINAARRSTAPAAY
ncbi:hypothetical protein ANCDUO_10447 [Ancylostoma duodenale]|uniref:Uncharacterized protein n=1 Tax=Ancylostoma duodenale TaxID=51022 RepID=A0A0C2DAF9_9BILA|nr:hypothetical protein ANCDUO_10447 [Ancylostoma duodenale]